MTSDNHCLAMLISPWMGPFFTFLFLPSRFPTIFLFPGAACLSFHGMEMNMKQKNEFEINHVVEYRVFG